MVSSLFSSKDASASTGQHQLHNYILNESMRLHREQKDRLLQDPNFRLLKVVHGEAQIAEDWNEIESLTVVIPARDPEISEDVQREGWYCLSHLWGDPSEWVVWDDAGVVDGRTGDPIKAKVHPSKRDEIKELLQGRSGYWWIDIFCAQSDTPLGIMGDIYKYCNRCSAVIDCPFEMFDSTSFAVFERAVGQSSRDLKRAAEGYLDIINKTHHKDSVSPEWIQVLKDVLHWPSTHFKENANQDIIQWKAHYSKTSRAKQFFDSLLQHPHDERIETALKFFNSKEYNPSDFTISEERLMELLQSSDTESLHRAQERVAEFLNCRWMNRVWTLQELALPRDTNLPLVGSRSYSVELGMVDFRTHLIVLTKAYEIRERTSMVRQSTRELRMVPHTPRQVLNYYQRTDPVLARIYSDYRKVLEVAITTDYTEFGMESDTNDNLRRRIILNSFATSQRKALYPEDYVYGVLGILGIDIPRLKDCDEIWRIFSKELREQYPDIRVPSDVNLAEATKMEDVYGGFGFPTGWDVSSQVVDYLCLMSL